MGISPENPTSPLFFSANTKTSHFPFLLFLPCAQTFLLPASIQFLKTATETFTPHCHQTAQRIPDSVFLPLFPVFPIFAPLCFHLIQISFLFFPTVFFFSFSVLFFILYLLCFHSYCSSSVPFSSLFCLFFDPFFVPLHFFFILSFVSLCFSYSPHPLCYGIFYAFYFSLAKYEYFTSS